MMLEETPSGNLLLLSRENPETRAKLTRADVRLLADLFELLDRWSREDAERRAAEHSA